MSRGSGQLGTRLSMPIFIENLSQFPEVEVFLYYINSAAVIFCRNGDILVEKNSVTLSLGTDVQRPKTMELPISIACNNDGYTSQRNCTLII